MLYCLSVKCQRKTINDLRVFINTTDSDNAIDGTNQLPYKI